MHKRARSHFGRFSMIATLFLAPLAMTTSCGDDGTCEENSECENGQECREGRDGNKACFCSPETRAGCGEGLECANTPDGDPGCFCSPEYDTGCPDVSLVCETVVNSTPACFPPVTLTGKVFDLASKAAIGGAHVLARDANFAAASGISVTDPMGAYTLRVPVPRNKDGTLTPHQVTLRSDAADYQTFPTAPRIALPIEMSEASGDPPNVQSTTTDIGMIEIPDTSGLGTISGKVVADRPWGTLVVAGGAVDAGGGASGVADLDGTYTVFNVEAASGASVRGYKQFLQLAGTTADVTAGATTANVDLHETGEATAVISGKIEVVNPGAGKDTSVILVVDETFVPNAARGEAPPGLRVWPISGDFSFEGVPDGNYVVLAAFENDFLVRDPDTAIGGTDIVHITVAGASQPLDQSFKVTGSLDVISPDKEEVVSGTPSFTWKDDSGEDHYEIRVYDAFGVLVWERLDVPGFSGDDPVVEYGDGGTPAGGEPLEPGMIYQFRATAIKQGGSPIAITEDLRGTFLYQ